MAPSSRAFRYVVVAALVFTLGSASIAVAGPTISGFVSLIDGSNTAKINALGELSVTDAGVQSAIASGNTKLDTADGHLEAIRTQAGRLSFDASGNLMVAPQGPQSVSVTGGTVNIGNVPAVRDGRVSTVASHSTVTYNGSVVTSAFIDVSAYSQVRVNVLGLNTDCASGPRFEVYSVVSAPGVFTFYRMDQVSGICLFSPYTKSFDLPGTLLAYAFIGGTAGQTATVDIVAR